jgi:hypothetical protein
MRHHAAHHLQAQVFAKRLTQTKIKTIIQTTRGELSPVAGFKSVWWPASSRNGGRIQIGSRLQVVHPAGFVVIRTDTPDGCLPEKEDLAARWRQLNDAVIRLGATGKSRASRST